MSDDVREPKAPAEGDSREIEENLEIDDTGDEAAPEPDVVDEADDGGEESQDQARQVQEVSRPRGRAAQRIERVDNENRQLREQIARFDRELTDLRQQQRQPTAAEIAEAERREAEAVQMMAPHEVARYYAQKSEQRVSAELTQTRQMLWDQNDQAKFETDLRTQPIFEGQTARQKQAIVDKVEEYRRMAPGVSRSILARLAIGDKAWDEAAGARTRARNRSETQLERQRTRPSNGRGDVAGPTDRGGSGTRWDRLRDVQI